MTQGPDTQGSDGQTMTNITEQHEDKDNTNLKMVQST